jgi:transposase
MRDMIRSAQAERFDARIRRANGVVFSYVSCEARVPVDHPLRLIRAVVDEALDVLSPEFDRLYARVGRPGIVPEKLLRALLLQAFYSVRSERQLMEQIGYNLLFRWFVGVAMDAPVWDATTFSENRDRLLSGDVTQRLLAAVVAQPRVSALMSDEHFSVDGTLIQAWASHKSFQPNPEADGGGPPSTPSDAPSPELCQAATPSRAGAGRNAATRRTGESRTRTPSWSSSRADRRWATSRERLGIPPACDLSALARMIIPATVALVNPQSLVNDSPGRKLHPPARAGLVRWVDTPPIQASWITATKAFSDVLRGSRKGGN